MVFFGADQLVIVAATYGKVDVTDRVRQLVATQGASIPAANHVFGDTWPGIRKALLVVYQYGPYGVPRSAFAWEGDTIHLSYNSNDWSSATPYYQQQATVSAPLEVLVAYYGSADVTQRVRQYVQVTGPFSARLQLQASNSVFGDPNPNQVKSLTVVYRQPEWTGTQVQGVVHVKGLVEHEYLNIDVQLNHSDLRILGATYGLADVTDRVRAYVQGNQAVIPAANNVYGDSWPNVRKSLVVVYQYGNRVAQTRVAWEGETIYLQFTPQEAQVPEQYAIAPWNYGPVARIVSARYGSADVTGHVQSLVSHGNPAKVVIQAENHVFGDPNPGQPKSLVVSYLKLKKTSNGPVVVTKIKTVAEHHTLKVKAF